MRALAGALIALAIASPALAQEPAHPKFRNFLEWLFHADNPATGDPRDDMVGCKQQIDRYGFRPSHCDSGGPKVSAQPPRLAPPTPTPQPQPDPEPQPTPDPDPEPEPPS